jgi:hypothetical protein
MPCIPFKDGIVCTGRPRRRRCKVPGCIDWSVALCDWKLHEVVDGKRIYTGETCDLPVCPRHRHQVGPDKDLCTPHHELGRQQGLVR